MKKERPILFNAPMVRAILAGTKTQTRRVVRPQFAADALPSEMPATDPIGGWVVAGHSGVWWCDAAANADDTRRCPYGRPGDRLWVRETIDHDAARGHFYKATGMYVGEMVDYEREPPPAIGLPLRQIPSIHMPRWASRITLEVTGVRVERLQDISEEDAAAEGVEAERPDTAVGAYEWLWESINGPGSWDANPWVWVVEFTRVTE